MRNIRVTINLLKWRLVPSKKIVAYRLHSSRKIPMDRIVLKWLCFKIAYDTLIPF